MQHRGSSGGRPSTQSVQDALLGWATEFLLFVDAEGDLVAATGAGLEALGYGPSERVGHHIAEHLHPEDLPMVLGIIQRAQTRGAGFRDHLQAKLGMAANAEFNNADGIFSPRVRVMKDAAKDPDYWAAKKLVVWCFSVRALTDRPASIKWRELPAKP